MIVGFSILGLLTGSRWDGAAPYVDPVMVLVTCVLFLPAPYRMVRGTVSEMMEAAPGSLVRVPVIEAIEAVIVHHQLDDPVIRLSKLGPRLSRSPAAMPATTPRCRQRAGRAFR